MKRYSTMLALVLSLTGGIAVAAQPGDFGAMLKHYEAIRQSLLHDTVDGVTVQAGEIVDLAGSAASNSEAADADVCSDTSDACDGILSAVSEAASRLRSAASLDESREAFAELSKALVKYRQGVDGPKPVVAHCSMAQKVWLQPKGEIGNPYYGQSMAGCGEIVSE